MEATLPQAVELEPMSVVTSGQGEYIVEREIGQGGFGSVYHVRSERGDFALKLTKMWKFTPNERIEYAKRFRQEYEYACLIPGENIVRPYDYDTYLGNPFIVMDYCPNGSLRKRIGEQIEAVELKRIACGILKGLRNMHCEGIIHRDLKPENILFDQENRPKLADFGISASIKSRMTRRNVLGQVKEVFASGVYSPPEQLDYARAFKVMGSTNDTYAFGVLMFETITGGKLPFGNFEDFQADIKGYEGKKRTGNWKREFLADASPEPVWNEIIERCLQFNPEERFQQVDEIIALLSTDNNSAAIKNQENNSGAIMLQVMNGDEIGRFYSLSNLILFSQPDWKLQYNVFANWLNDNFDNDTSWTKENLCVLTIGWYDKEDPFANSIGIAEHFTNYVSGAHATLVHNSQTNKWYLFDGQPVQSMPGILRLPIQIKLSTNGTFINSASLQKGLKELKVNDIISLGDTTLKVVGL
ncbi:serine/threonine protein kinase [Pontibacter aydingkolensis]|uniref:non-specific serine/threonine protein kinase n=1 Tax=Pontibacter aydingkolensis TaxID=1911536 RepID=A0ABS7CSP3_9BACT|nr:FHA domain-containing serine/threonine-protein kinase [Pontibacter aydingkolensis]MBW7466867.1 protein kinase [Pontibacter aydingkolensis]